MNRDSIVNNTDFRTATFQSDSRGANQNLLVAVRAGIVLMLLCGGLYTGLVTQLGEWIFPHQATGSLVQENGRNLGSEWVGQSFVSPNYFHGRPSAANYDPMATGGSNLAPSNPELRAVVEQRSLIIQEQEGTKANTIPVDLLSASGAGLDPHISPDAALLQAPRIARVRNLSETQIKSLITEHIEMPQWGILGQKRVNVLKLNLALDKLQKN
ncbi:potassium-transporting ATPase subunit KdpC [Vibrio fluvialis]|uniref:potassium-transporting ATPase subunit KdpC n=1 Tax=Vibrio fluvialis TaxID=676 RepID=UPI001C9CCDA0|nr:potassium-transporting ATPase subunit KdpC [Vibrio fluvialis]EKO3433633.1 potassium-transporting ATPase subunit KdpC [Vibrio fluvialis]EKO3516778.1 potassium-transporting ATPase subunit KdpC [Vibrio fluvialis]MBY7834174.1 potassium-transporting ATPase subunit KdpC [Vibrio fluvialis]MBY7848513.1 potassium-transporting ATPase subunit KdpC [Vibrio fluvialis]MBY7937976.1 potassium-transporting ATPase subunit KdpC [Vibrio fluvialis]